jgi:hypothetical protein
MSKRDELPPVSDFSIDGILSAIQPDIEDTIDAIAEIMGRSRLSLANEYDSHMPPQGEIRASSRNALLTVEEASSSNEQLAVENVIIVPDDASLVDGSHIGSAAYGLLERLRLSPRARQLNTIPPRPFSPPDLFEGSGEPLSPTTAQMLLNNGASVTQPTVSETYLSAGANDRLASSPIVMADVDPPLYYNEPGVLDELPELQTSDGSQPIQARMRNLSLISDLRGLAAWLQREKRGDSEHPENAESKLRIILEKNASEVEQRQPQNKS